MLSEPTGCDGEEGAIVTSGTWILFSQIEIDDYIMFFFSCGLFSSLLRSFGRGSGLPVLCRACGYFGDGFITLVPGFYKRCG